MTLNFISRMLKEGVFTLKIVEEENTCIQTKEWQKTLIGYRIGDKSFELETIAYVKKV